jgi:U3 small nucleolar RNA-associated protein 4
VWRIQNKPEEGGGDDEELVSFAGGWDKVLEMEFMVHSNITAHEISDDGKWLVISDMYETKLFKLQTDASFSAYISETPCILIYSSTCRLKAGLISNG